MKILWTKSGKPLSLLIRKGLQDPCSHFVIYFDEYQEIFQSNLLGTGLEYDGTFLNSCEVVHSIDVSIDKEILYSIRFSILKKYDGKKYDYKAFFYFMWRAVLNRYFKVEYPKINKWQDKNSFLCVGLAKALDIDGVPEYIRTAVRSIEDTEMMSPEDLFLEISKKLPS